MNAHNGEINPFPSNYAEWKQAITVRGKLEFSPAVLENRLRELSNTALPATKEFIRLYGDAHHQQICTWYQQAVEEAKKR